jgi:hypothetical protein
MGWKSWDKVTRMAGNREDDGPGYGLLQEVRAYWEALRPDGGLPERASIDPRGLERALEHVFLVERIAPGLARFRIAGMSLTVLMGMEVRGMPLSALFDGPGRERLQGLLEQVFAGPSVLELALEGERGIGRPSLEGRMILLPVRGDAGGCDRALGCLVAVGPIGRTPRRFSVARQVTEALGPADVIVRTGPAPVLQPGLSEAAAAFRTAPPAALPGANPRRAHLRLVKSND